MRQAPARAVRIAARGKVRMSRFQREERMSTGISRLFRRWPAAVAAAGASIATAAFAEANLNLQEPMSELARNVYDLHTVITLICFVIFLGVFGVMFYSVYAHRKSKGH